MRIKNSSHDILQLLERLLLVLGSTPLHEQQKQFRDVELLQNLVFLLLDLQEGKNAVKNLAVSSAAELVLLFAVSVDAAQDHLKGWENVVSCDGGDSLL